MQRRSSATATACSSPAGEETEQVEDESGEDGDTEETEPESDIEE